jgi:hypothetical protein
VNIDRILPSCQTLLKSCLRFFKAIEVRKGVSQKQRVRRQPFLFRLLRESDAAHVVVSSKLAPVFSILRFHLRHELDEFGRLSDAAQINITLEQGIAWKTHCGSFS